MAAYNNFYPASYQPFLPQHQVQNNNQSIVWVQGEAGAKSVPVAPGQKVLLMDSETNVFYVKSSDVSGMPLPLRIFEYKEVSKVATEDSTASAQNTYVTHEELERILADLKPKEQPKQEKKEVKKNEFLI